MRLAKVVGNVVAAVRADGLKSPSFLLVAPLAQIEKFEAGKPPSLQTPLIALDLIGANQDELVLISQGSSVRQSEETIDKAVDAVICGIVDQVAALVENQEVVVFDKNFHS